MDLGRFKSEYQEELFYQYIAKLNSTDRYYKTFAYVASAIGKKSLITALSDHRIDREKLLDLAGAWSSSERKMLEFAYQCFTGSNLFEEEEDGVTIPSYPTIDNIFSSLDNENARIVIQALAMRYI